jgi:hypothetical protein
VTTVSVRVAALDMRWLLTHRLAMRVPRIVTGSVRMAVTHGVIFLHFSASRYDLLANHP